MATLCLIPVIVLAAWFVELYSLNKVRSASAPAPVQEDPLPTKDVQQILNKR